MGKKDVLVGRFVEKLNDAYQRRDANAFNAIIKVARQYAIDHHYLWSDYQEPEVEPAFLRASKLKAFTPPADLDGLAPFRIVESISDPVFFPALPVNEVDFVRLPVQLNPPSLPPHLQAALLVFKIYDAPNLPDNPDSSSVRFRLSKGKRAWFTLNEEALHREPGKYFYPVETYYFPQDGGPTSLTISNVKRSFVREKHSCDMP